MVLGQSLGGCYVVAPDVVVQLLESVETGLTSSSLLVALLQKELCTEVTLSDRFVIVESEALASS